MDAVNDIFDLNVQIDAAPATGRLDFSAEDGGTWTCNSCDCQTDLCAGG